MYTDPFCIYISSFIWTWKILIVSVLWSAVCEEFCPCFVLFCFLLPNVKKDWLIQVHTIAPQIWEKSELELFSVPRDRTGGWKTKMALLWPNSHSVKSFPDGPALAGERTSSVKKYENKTRPVRLVFFMFLVRGEGVAWPLASWTSGWQFKNLSVLFHECCRILGRM